MYSSDILKLNLLTSSALRGFPSLSSSISIACATVRGVSLGTFTAAAWSIAVFTESSVLATPNGESESSPALSSILKVIALLSSPTPTVKDAISVALSTLILESVKVTSLVTWL